MMIWHLIKDLWQNNRRLFLVFVLAVFLAGFFGTRSLKQFIYWADPAHQDQALAGWMTPRYVGQSYNIPPEIVQQALGITDANSPRRVTLDRIAQEQSITVDEMQVRIEAAVKDWRDLYHKADQ